MKVEYPGKIVSLGCGNEKIRKASIAVECLTHNQKPANLVSFSTLQEKCFDSLQMPRIYFPQIKQIKCFHLNTRKSLLSGDFKEKEVTLGLTGSEEEKNVKGDQNQTPNTDGLPRSCVGSHYIIFPWHSWQLKIFYKIIGNISLIISMIVFLKSIK